jgi:hypothetical protein
MNWKRDERGDGGRRRATDIHDQGDPAAPTSWKRMIDERNDDEERKVPALKLEADWYEDLVGRKGRELAHAHCKL